MTQNPFKIDQDRGYINFPRLEVDEQYFRKLFPYKNSHIELIKPHKIFQDFASGTLYASLEHPAVASYFYNDHRNNGALCGQVLIGGEVLNLSGLWSSRPGCFNSTDEKVAITHALLGHVVIDLHVRWVLKNSSIHFFKIMMLAFREIDYIPFDPNLNREEVIARLSRSKDVVIKSEIIGVDEKDNLIAR